MWKTQKSLGKEEEEKRCERLINWSLMGLDKFKESKVSLCCNEETVLIVWKSTCRHNNKHKGTKEF